MEDRGQWNRRQNPIMGRKRKYQHWPAWQGCMMYKASYLDNMKVGRPEDSIHKNLTSTQSNSPESGHFRVPACVCRDAGWRRDGGLSLQSSSPAVNQNPKPKPKIECARTSASKSDRKGRRETRRQESTAFGQVRCRRSGCQRARRCTLPPAVWACRVTWLLVLLLRP